MVAVDGSTATTTLAVDSAAIGTPGLVDVAAAGTVSPTSADDKLGADGAAAGTIDGAAEGAVDGAAAGTVSPTSADNKLGFESRFLCKVWQHLFAETGV